MIKFMLVAFLLQVQGFPEIPLPTPFQSPTPNPTVEAAQSEVEIPQDEILNQLSTVEAESQAMATQIVASNGQLYYRGVPLLPFEDGKQIWGYWKWISGTSSYSLFGPFQPIFFHLGILVLLVLVGLLFYFSQMVLGLISRFALWLWDTVQKIIPG